MTSEILNSLLLAAYPVAAATPPASEDATYQMIKMAGFMAIMFFLFYLVLIRPQQKQQKELKKMLDALKVGDRVLLTCGFFGIVSQIKDKAVVVKIGENTKVEMLRSGIQQVLVDKEEKK